MPNTLSAKKKGASPHGGGLHVQWLERNNDRLTDKIAAMQREARVTEKVGTTKLSQSPKDHE